MQFPQALTLFVTLLGTASAVAVPQSNSNEDGIITTNIAGNTVKYHESDPTASSLLKRDGIEKRFILPGFRCTAGKNQCTEDTGCYMCNDSGNYLCQSLSDLQQGYCQTNPVN
ncbi:hypothetical protein EV356DRAFT_519078 [Viridothelium virens]|uniref:Uncharacterized protein n=1 Tax=Viridothelium virens TaxID=1048519 RepID=A0A6A6GZQ1_VIRVR|nr:hypothetical protein EV356DRAFT_519078 [Viridothelium virens]